MSISWCEFTWFKKMNFNYKYVNIDNFIVQNCFFVLSVIINITIHKKNNQNTTFMFSLFDVFCFVLNQIAYVLWASIYFVYWMCFSPIKWITRLALCEVVICNLSFCSVLFFWCVFQCKVLFYCHLLYKCSIELPQKQRYYICYILLH